VLVAIMEEDERIRGTSKWSRGCWLRMLHFIPPGKEEAAMEGESLITSYRKNASYCRVKAARTEDAEDKTKWLEFADTWEMLADRVARESSSPNVVILKQQAQPR
jgi:hypothetical protein